jgi:hypothetical protein
VAAKGVDFLVPLNPDAPALLQATVSPFSFVIVTKVLLKVAETYTFPFSETLRVDFFLAAFIFFLFLPYLFSWFCLFLGAPLFPFLLLLLSLLLLLLTSFLFLFWHLILFFVLLKARFLLCLVPLYEPISLSLLIFR